MTIVAQIEALEGLADLDAELANITGELEREREQLGDKQTRLAALDERLDRDRVSLKEMENTRSELMTEVRQMNAQIERSRDKLARCRTEREVNAAQRELEELRKLQRDRETEISKLGELAEQARTTVGQIEKDKNELLSELDASEGDVTTHLKELQQQAQAKQEARQEFASRLQPQLYRRYEMIRKRRGTAIAHTTTGNCSACHIVLSPMMFHQLSRGTEFGQCPSCNRILYFRTTEAAPSESESDSDSQPSGV